MPATTTRPRQGEFDPYYDRYISRVPEGNLIALLRDQMARSRQLLDSVPESRGSHRYAAGKWSIKDVVGHVADTERIMSYRALRIARGDQTPLPGFEQDDYVRGANFDRRTLADLVEELSAIRRATVALFEPLDDEALSRHGTANGVPITPRAIGYIIAGHELHHLEVLRTKYLG